MAQVTANLVENALRYASHEVRVAATNGTGRPELWVQDDGPGIAPADLPRVFDRLFVCPDPTATARLARVSDWRSWPKRGGGHGWIGASGVSVGGARRDPHGRGATAGDGARDVTVFEQRAHTLLASDLHTGPMSTLRSYVSAHRWLSVAIPVMAVVALGERGVAYASINGSTSTIAAASSPTTIPAAGALTRSTSATMPTPTRRLRLLRGKVTAISGSTWTVETWAGRSVTVKITSTTKFGTKAAPSNEVELPRWY